MAVTMKFVTSQPGSSGRGAVVRASSSVRPKRSAGAGVRPNQCAIGVNDLTQQERDELANLLEAELARL